MKMSLVFWRLVAGRCFCEVSVCNPMEDMVRVGILEMMVVMKRAVMPIE
jgi:hypothetical protein